jgi:intracellular septation protein
MKKAISIFSPKMLKHIFFSGLLEFGPVLLFLASTEYVSVYESAVILMVATIISTIATFSLQKRIPYLALYVALLTIVFGYMALHFRNPKFLQMRDTLYDLTSALTLVVGLVFKTPFLKLAFHEVIPMSNRAWQRMTHVWIAYFLIVAFSNEIVRNFFSFSDWIFFKEVVIVFTVLYSFASLYSIYEPPTEKHHE